MAYSSAKIRALITRWDPDFYYVWNSQFPVNEIKFPRHETSGFLQVSDIVRIKMPSNLEDVQDPANIELDNQVDKRQAGIIVDMFGLSEFYVVVHLCFPPENEHYYEKEVASAKTYGCVAIAYSYQFGKVALFLDKIEYKPLTLYTAQITRIHPDRDWIAKKLGTLFVISDREPLQEITDAGLVEKVRQRMPWKNHFNTTTAILAPVVQRASETGIPLPMSNGQRQSGARIPVPMPTLQRATLETNIPLPDVQRRVSIKEEMSQWDGQQPTAMQSAEHLPNTIVDISSIASTLELELENNLSVLDLDTNPSTPPTEQQDDANAADEFQIFGAFVVAHVEGIHEIDPEAAIALRTKIVDECKKCMAHLQAQQQEQLDMIGRFQTTTTSSQSAANCPTITIRGDGGNLNLATAANHGTTTTSGGQLSSEMLLVDIRPTTSNNGHSDSTTTSLNNFGRRPSTLAQWNGPMNSWPTNLMD